MRMFEGRAAVVTGGASGLGAAAAAALAGAGMRVVVVDLNEGSDPITQAVERLQTDVLVRLNDNWQIAAVVLTAIVLAALAYVVLRRDEPAVDEAVLPDPHPDSDVVDAQR